MSNSPLPATSYLIIAMREKWLNLILSGQKTAEVRRTRPARPWNMPNFLYLYHRGCIHGVAEVRGYSVPVSIDNKPYWARWVSYEYDKEACLTKSEMLDYLKNAPSPVVYLLGRVQRFPKPIPVPCRPQSWQYATPGLLDTITRKEKTNEQE